MNSMEGVQTPKRVASKTSSWPRRVRLPLGPGAVSPALSRAWSALTAVFGGGGDTYCGFLFGALLLVHRSQVDPALHGTGHGIPTVDGGNPFEPPNETMVETIISWYLQGNHPSRVSQVVQEFVHP